MRPALSFPCCALSRARAALLTDADIAAALRSHRMPGWKRALMRPNWSWISNAFFFGSCVGYTVSACWGLQYDRAVPLLNISGRELIAYGYLFGALGFLIEPLFDVLGCWVEAWDDILYTAKEASEQMLSPTKSIRQDLAPTYTAQSVAWLMVREPYFWAAVVFELGSVLYFWQALVPFVYGDFCDRCGFHWQQAWFVCVDLEQGYPDRRMLWERGGEGLNGTVAVRRLVEEGSDGGHSGSWYNSRDHGYWSAPHLPHLPCRSLPHLLSILVVSLPSSPYRLLPVACAADSTRTSVRPQRDELARGVGVRDRRADLHLRLAPLPRRR